ncbi:MAG TPA: hypothetical protein PLA92_07280, partial [Fimbriimonadaceae bacterium]|nr:hypothetical protein [Fimbriimonadaceae bacterium]
MVFIAVEPAESGASLPRPGETLGYLSTILLEKWTVPGGKALSESKRAHIIGMRPRPLGFKPGGGV